MNALSLVPPRQVLAAFAAGVVVTALLMLSTGVLAQSPSPTPMPAPSIDQMVAWCRQMMSQAGMMMQGMMSGMCMMGR